MTNIPISQLRVATFDLGTTTGWASSHRGKITDSGSLNFKPSNFEGGGMRYVKFREFLNTKFKGTLPQIVYYESIPFIHHGSNSAAQIMGGLMATLHMWCEDHSIPYAGVPNGTIKKHISGKGNANKKLVLKCVRNTYPKLDVKDHNHADALALLDYILRTH